MSNSLENLLKRIKYNPDRSADSSRPQTEFEKENKIMPGQGPEASLMHPKFTSDEETAFQEWLQTVKNDPRNLEDIKSDPISMTNYRDDFYREAGPDKLRFKGIYGGPKASEGMGESIGSRSSLENVSYEPYYGSFQSPDKRINNKYQMLKEMLQRK